MFKNIKLKYKIYSIPGIIVVVFFLTEIVVQMVNNRQIGNYYRTIEFSSVGQDLYREISTKLTGLKHMVNVVQYRGDETAFDNADQAMQGLLTLIQDMSEKANLATSLRDSLQNAVRSFYSSAQQVVRQRSSAGNTSVQRDQIRLDESYSQLQSDLQKRMAQSKADLVRLTRLVVSSRSRMLGIVSIFVLIGLGLVVAYTAMVTKPMIKSMDYLTELSTQVADGNLALPIEGSADKDEIGLLRNAFKRMVESLRKLTGQIKEGANSLAAAAGQITASVTEIAAAATETASAATETSTTVEEVRQTAMDSNRKAKNVSESSQKAVEVSQAGEKAVANTIDGMNKIEAQMASIAESIMKLSEHGQAIGGIMATVESIAEQSRLLAVNASIEAVKAGEQGKGFVVVAQEVRNLAEQSKQATQRVRGILDDIQKSTSEAVMKTEQGSKAVEAGVRQSTEAGEAIQRLAAVVGEAAQATTQISVSSQEQLVGMDQVVSAMESIKQASTQNVGATKQVESASHSLTELGQELKGIIDQYRL